MRARVIEMPVLSVREGFGVLTPDLLVVDVLLDDDWDIFDFVRDFL